MKGYWANLRPFEKRVFVGVTTMLFIVFNMWFVFPHFADWGKVQARMSTAQDKVQKFEKEIKQIPVYTAEIRKRENEGLSVPLEDQQIHFLRAVQQQALDSKIGGLNIGRQNFATNQFFLELSQQISMTCGESELVHFLYNLGAGTSLIRVRDLTLKPDVPRHQLNAQVKLVASYQKKAPARAPAGGAPAATSKSAEKSKTTEKAKTQEKSKSAPPPKAAPSTNKPSTTKKS